MPNDFLPPDHSPFGSDKAQLVYGEQVPNPTANNLCGKVYQVFDQSGVVTNQAWDFKGNLASGQRQLAKSYKTVVDWTNPDAVELEQEVYTHSATYNALNQMVTVTSPDNSTNKTGSVRVR